MAVDEIYLENTKTRHAFYYLRIEKNDSLSRPYKIMVNWGRLGTNGQQKQIALAISLDQARVKMYSLAEAKKFRNYTEKPYQKSFEPLQPPLSPEEKIIDENMMRFADLE